MEGLRKFGLWLAALIVGPAVIAGIVSFAFTRTMGSPDYVKQTFVEVKVYEALGNFLKTEAAKSTEEGSAIVQQALAKTVTEVRLQRVMEQAVDQAYAVLNGEIQAKEFSVDITELKDEFLKNFDNDLTKELTSLPACTYANQPTSTDVLEYSCLPTGADVDKIVAQAKKEALAQNEIIKSGEVSINDIQTNEQNDAETPAQSPSNPAESFQQVADAYQLSKLVLPVSLGFAVLSAAGVVILSKSRLRGGKRLGILLLINALVLALVALGAKTIGQNLPVASNDSGVTPSAAFELAGQMIVVDYAQLVLKLGLVMFIFGVALAILSSVLISKHEPKSEEPPTANKNEKTDTETTPKQK